MVQSLLVLALVPQLIAAAVIQARQTVTCDFSTAANDGDTCDSFASGWGLSVANFQAINPGVSCPTLTGGENYCVIGETSGPSPTTTSSTKAAVPTTTKVAVPTTTSTTAKAPVTTAKPTTTSAPTTTAPTSPGPTQPGLAANCNKYHKVVSGDQCGAIESAAGISAADFATWNPYIDSNCGNLWLDYVVCIGVQGSTPVKTTTTAQAATTTAGSAPGPTQPGLASNCKKYHKVVSGDQCGAIESAAGVSASDFAKWNPYIDSACSNLWLDYFVCIGVPGSTPVKTTTAAPAPTSNAPSPLTPGTISSCKTYYQVVSGDGCQLIEQKKGVSAANFAKWNPSIDSACSNLWLGYYVCVGA